METSNFEVRKKKVPSAHLLRPRSHRWQMMEVRGEPQCAGLRVRVCASASNRVMHL